MALPHVTLTGNLTNDPELRHTNSGKPVVNLRVATSSRRRDEQGNWVDGDTTFLNVTAWWNAEAIASNVKKGQSVVVIGELKQREYEKDGVKHTVHELTADTVAAIIRDDNRNASQQSSPTPAAADPWANSGSADYSEDTPF